MKMSITDFNGEIRRLGKLPALFRIGYLSTICQCAFLQTDGRDVYNKLKPEMDKEFSRVLEDLENSPEWEISVALGWMCRLPMSLYADKIEQLRSLCFKHSESPQGAHFFRCLEANAAEYK
jgi:hypothetical protein